MSVVKRESRKDQKRSEESNSAAVTNLGLTGKDGFTNQRRDDWSETSGLKSKLSDTVNCKGMFPPLISLPNS